MGVREGGMATPLLGQKLGDPRALRRYLVRGGAVLVLLELTFVHVAWTFAFDSSNMLAGVIWMLGWNMPLVRGAAGAWPCALDAAHLATRPAAVRGSRFAIRD
jgi:uncharacterized membrane protein